MQEGLCSEYKRKHCRIFQTLTTSIELQASLFNPEVERKHGIKMYRESKWKQISSETLKVNCIQYWLYETVTVHAFYAHRWYARTFESR